jgi:hypothetical protein
VAGFCHIWISGYSSLAKPLYEAMAGSGKDPLNWGFEQEKAFQEIKRLLTSAPSLGLPDVKRPFNLFVCEKKHTALGVLTQMVGPWQHPVAYLSKRLDPVASGWPPCLWALAATVTLIREADKLTLRQDVNVKASHVVIALINGQGHKWLTSSIMAHYQGLLCENPRVRLETLQTLNPATLLPTEEGIPDHDCKEVMDEVYSSRPDLMDIPLSDPELELFTDGSSFIQNGRRKAGFPGTTADNVIQAEALPQSWSAGAELWALIQALRYAKGK